jgi:hypothetical protein
MARKHDCLYPGKLCRREWTDLRWLDPMCSGPDSDLAHLEMHLAALHRDFPETRRCTVEDVSKFLFSAHQPGQCRLSAMMSCSAPLVSGLPYGIGRRLSAAATTMNPAASSDSVRADKLPFLPPLIPSIGHQLSPQRVAPSSAALGPAPDLGQELAAAAAAAAAVGWGGCGGPGGLVDEVLRSRLLLAHYSSILQAFLPAHNPPLLNPALLGGFPSLAPLALAGGVDCGWPSAALVASVSHPPLSSAVGMPEGPAAAGLLLAALPAASTPALVSGGGGVGDWRGGSGSHSWH